MIFPLTPPRRLLPALEEPSGMVHLLRLPVAPGQRARAKCGAWAKSVAAPIPHSLARCPLCAQAAGLIPQGPPPPPAKSAARKNVDALCRCNPFNP